MAYDKPRQGFTYYINRDMWQDNKTQKFGRFDYAGNFILFPEKPTQDPYYEWKLKPEAERTTGMNNSLAIFLISDEARAIKCAYDPEQEESKQFYIFKTLDPKVKAGDFVIVESKTRWDMSVVKVIETDVDVDFDSTSNYKWIVGVVPKADFDALKEQEAQAVKRISAADKRKKRDELREAMIKNAEGDLKGLPFYTPPEPAEKKGGDDPA